MPYNGSMGSFVPPPSPVLSELTSKYRVPAKKSSGLKATYNCSSTLVYRAVSKKNAESFSWATAAKPPPPKPNPPNVLVVTLRGSFRPPAPARGEVDGLGYVSALLAAALVARQTCVWWQRRNDMRCMDKPSASCRLRRVREWRGVVPVNDRIS
jgi:hypothetical protein